MKRYGALLALVLAVGCGLLAVVLANKWLSARSRQAESEEGNRSVQVVVAAKDLHIGTPLSAENVVLTEWPEASVPKGALHSLEAIKDRTVITRLWAGEPVLAAQLAAPGSGAGMVATIAPGKRAMAVKVDEVSGVGGFILPNTYVDVIAVDSDRDNSSVKTLLNKIKVLAIAQETYTEDGKPKLVKTVTLELLPREAEKLALQMSDGGIYLALRNPLDESQPPPPEPVTVVASRPQRAAYVPKPELKFEVEVIRRSKRESLNFKD